MIIFEGYFVISYMVIYVNKKVLMPHWPLPTDMDGFFFSNDRHIWFDIGTPLHLLGLGTCN